MGKDKTTRSKRSRNDKYTKLQKKRRRFFYSHNHDQQQQQKKPLGPGWPINVDSIRLCKKKKKDDQQSPSSDGITTTTHTDRVLDVSLEKLYECIDVMTSLRYKSTLDNAVDNATNMIRDVLKVIVKNERLATPPPSSSSPPPPPLQESSHLGYEDVLLAALGANLPPLVIQRALARMKTIIPLEDQATEQIIQLACYSPDVFGAAGKSLVSMESIYGFFSPIEREMTTALLPVEAEIYKNEPMYMKSLRPSISSGGMDSSMAVEHAFLNLATEDGTFLPSESL